MKPHTILVTGGAGFIGSHIVEALVHNNHKVIVLDNLSTGSIKNIAHLQSAITFIEADIRDIKNCINTAQNCNIIIHCAALVSVVESCADPMTCLDVNVRGTLNMLQAAIKNKVERFIFSSSSAVYGNRNESCAETDECVPLSPYGYSKWIGEHLCQKYAALHKLQTVSLRYFNVFGPRQSVNSPYSAVIAQFSHYMKHNHQITIYGDGLQTRDFVPVHDIVRANCYFALTHRNPLYGEIFNIASGESITINEVVQQLQSKFPHFNAPITYKAARKGDIKHSRANCAKYRALLHAQ